MSAPVPMTNSTCEPVGPPELLAAATTRSTVVVPDQFLRRWDPVTVFFDDRQVDKPGPADVPDRYARLSPAHPGAWQWLDRRTLQFRPAEPWPALQRFTVRADGRETPLATLMTPPRRTVPRDGADGLEPVDYELAYE